MTEANPPGVPWERPLHEDPELEPQAQELKEERLLLDVRPPQENTQALLQPMSMSGLRFKITATILGGFVIMMLTTWVYQMWNGLGVTGLNRPVMWALYIVNFV